MHPSGFLRSLARTWRRHGVWAACQWGLEALIKGIVPFERLHIIELQRDAELAGLGRTPPPAAPRAGAGHPPEAVVAPAFSTRVADDATLEALHLAKRGLERAWVGAVSHTLGPWLHRRLLRQARRSDHHTYTCFHRSPVQLAALTGPVLAHLGMDRSAPVHRPERRARTLRVVLFACSNGAEAYTLSAWLAQERPDLDVVIEASDLHPDMVEQARRGRYTWDEVAQHHPLPERFIAQVFDCDGDHFVVNQRTRSRVRFSCADIVRDDLRGRFGEADVVLAQNVLFHLPPAMARRAFANIVATVAPGGALFVEGMDQDLRLALTMAHELTPLGWRTRDIYEESRRHIPARWWQVYYGAEPWSPLRSEPQRRYGSIFLKEPGRPLPSAQALAA